jgi:hypothetical protein
MNKNILYTKVLEKWGYYSQIDMCIEEMAELTKALCKAKRSKKPENWLMSVYEEIADVAITLEQMSILFDGEEAISYKKEEKLLRLKRLIEEK